MGQNKVSIQVVLANNTLNLNPGHHQKLYRIHQAYSPKIPTFVFCFDHSWNPLSIYVQVLEPCLYPYKHTKHHVQYPLLFQLLASKMILQIFPYLFTLLQTIKVFKSFYFYYLIVNIANTSCFKPFSFLKILPAKIPNANDGRAEKITYNYNFPYFSLTSFSFINAAFGT